MVNLGHKAVLIVDDVEEMRNLLATVLMHYGFNNIFHAQNGDRAMEIAANFEIDLAFLDINMPGLDGLEVLRELKSRNEQIFTVMVSGAGTLDNVRKAKRYGANAFLVKPCRAGKIDEVVQKYAHILQGQSK
ncbi:MAG: response regulator [Ketobacteraceae bacterium]|nr:response regulator [Ketobacteraceae bacterium]